MKKLAPSLVLGAVLLLGSAGPVFATPVTEDTDQSCTITTTWVKVIDVPYSAAVYETIPAVYVTEYEFAFKKDHPNSPRWELEGWNADSNPHSHGWHATGNTRQKLVTEETTVLVTPEVAEVSHEEQVDTRVCVDIPPVVVPPVVVPPVVVPPVVVPPVVVPPVVTPPVVVVPPVVADVKPVAEVVPVKKTAAVPELAQTGAKEDALILQGSLALGAMALGAGLLWARRKLTP